MSLHEILRNKGNKVLSISPHATLDDVVQKLVKNNCGSLVVCEEDDPCRMVGIITERDILRACAAKNAPLDQVLVNQCMTRNPVTGLPDDSIQSVMGLMTERRIRHLPILNYDGMLIGLISIGDLVKQQHDELSRENHYLKSYIQG
jgi:CBS domain-containing protein